MDDIPIIDSTPIPVKRALRRLGFDLADARKRRRIPMWLAAERASISRTTLSKIEKGDYGVSIGAYAKVFFIMGMLDRFAELADAKFDRAGLGLEAEKLPKRVRLSRRRS